MRRMHALALSMVVFAAPSAFALDEYLPIPPRKMEIDLGFSRNSVLGYYGTTGSFVDAPNPEVPLSIPFQGKFGLAEGLNAELEVTYLVNDLSGKSGIDRPLLSLKYAHPVQGYGGFMAVTLPFGFEDVVSTDPYASIGLGALYGRTFKDFRILANGAFWYNTEDVDRRKQDYFSFFVKPEYSLTLPQLKNRYLGLYVAGTYDVYLEELENNVGTHKYGYLVNLAPGVFFKLNQNFAFETRVPFTLMGENRQAEYGLWTRVFMTLDMEM